MFVNKVLPPDVDMRTEASLEVSHSLHPVAEEWKVYDVTVDDISIISAYRSDLPAS